MAGYMPVVYEIGDLLSYCFLLLFRTYGPTFSSLVVLGRRRECVMFVFMGGVRDILGQQCAVPRFGYQYFWKRRRGMSGRRAGACMERPPVPAAFPPEVTLACTFRKGAAGPPHLAVSDDSDFCTVI